MNGEHAAISSKARFWLKAGIAFAILGMLASGYALYHHLEVRELGATQAACNINAMINCDAVSKSTYSEFLGRPLGVWGLGFFFSNAVLLLLTLLGMGSTFFPIYTLLALGGVLGSVALALISIVAVKAICLVCVGIYILSLLLALILFPLQELLAEADFELRSMLRAAMVPLFGAAFFFGTYTLLPTPVPHAIAQDRTEPAHKIEALSPIKKDIPLDRSPYSGLGEDYRSGADDARVIIQGFSDFQCPACRGMSNILHDIKEAFGDRILIVFRNFPLDQSCNPEITHRMHEYACEAATIARCAGRYGKFWEFYDAAFKNQDSISHTAIQDWGRGAGLTDDVIKACQTDAGIKAKLQEDIALASKLGVNATPTLFINGHQFSGGEEALKREIDRLLSGEAKKSP